MRVIGNHVTAGGGYGGDHSAPLPRRVFRDRTPPPPSPTRLREPSDIPADRVVHASRKGIASGPRPDNWENPLMLGRPTIEKIISLYEGGLSVNKISSETGVAKSTVLRHLKASGVEIRGAEKPLDMKAIMEKYSAGASMRELAREYGVAAATISRRMSGMEGK